ncbi:FecR family protein [Gaoshiqia sp. Z1-71]|uniref:FecR family protein n=1 Tax=Gaoshiqia hydrogeniformans TaxID=3290090 RepID=UPI003BF7B2BC
MKDFFKKYLENNCSEKEFDSVVELFSEPSGQPELERQMKEHWDETSSGTRVPELADTLYKIHYEINKRDQAPVKTRKLLNYLTRVAAILLLPLAIAYVVSLQKNDQPEDFFQTITTPLASKTSFELPDGSLVWLNSGSSLRFPKAFNGDSRLVSLTGEAYFDVKKADRPFKVETALFTVDVLGTAFNVMAYDGEVPLVTLERGKVRLETKSKQQEVLEPGQQAVIDTLNHSVTLGKVDPALVSSWVHNRLVFRSEPLGAVVNRLGRWYNIDIEVTGSALMDIPVTANIEFESIREIMELMELTLPVKYQYNKEKRKLVITQTTTKSDLPM